MWKAQIIELFYSLHALLFVWAGKYVWVCLEACYGSRIIENGFIHGNHECKNEWLNSNKSLSLLHIKWLFLGFLIVFQSKAQHMRQKKSLEVSEDSANKAENLPKSPAMKMLP